MTERLRLGNAIGDHVYSLGRNVKHINDKATRDRADHDDGLRQGENPARQTSKHSWQPAVKALHLRVKVQHGRQPQRGAHHNQRALSKQTHTLGHIDVDTGKAAAQPTLHDGGNGAKQNPERKYRTACATRVQRPQ